MADQDGGAGLIPEQLPETTIDTFFAADVRVGLIGADAEIGIHVAREVHALVAGIAFGFV